MVVAIEQQAAWGGRKRWQQTCGTISYKALWWYCVKMLWKCPIL